MPLEKGDRGLELIHCPPASVQVSLTYFGINKDNLGYPEITCGLEHDGTDAAPMV